MNADAPPTEAAVASSPLRHGVLWRVAALCAVALLSLIVTKLALFAAVGTLLGYVSLPSEPARVVRRLKLALLLAGACATFGVFRFLVLEAVPGMVEGGTTATEQRVVSRLRELLFAEDAWRKNAFFDPDRDQIGSAGLLGELSGQIGIRGGKASDPPVLQNYPSLIETAIGPAAQIGGYFVIVCLPKLTGGFTASPNDAIDDERAEREFRAYAWPAERGQGLTTAYFLDEHERILLADSRETEPRRLSGLDATPSCDDVSAPATQSEWRVWRHKVPRRTLPFDRH